MLMSKPTVFNKQAVQQSFDIAADSYNQFTSLQRTIGDRLFCEIEKKVLGSVIDIGSGTGYLTKKLSALSAVDDLYALDMAAGMLQQTKANVSGAQLNGLICADAESLPLANGSVNAVCSNLAYQWCSNLQYAISEVYRTLQSQGYFAFSTFGPQTLQELKKAWGQVDDAVHVNAFEPVDKIQQYLKNAGFENISVTSENIEMYYDSPKQLMLDLKGMGAHNVNKGRRKGLTGIQAFKSMLSAYERLRVAEGVPATYEAVYVYAQKPTR